jgi:uncharacterized protein (TIGR02271 family)
MAEDVIAVVHLGEGARGTAKIASLTRPDGVVVVTLDDGRIVEAPASAFERRGAGEFVLPITVETSKASTETIIPVVAEHLEVSRRVVNTGKVRIRKTVQHRQETVDEPLIREEVQVRRVTVEPGADAPTEIRHEGDTLIVPVVEEVLVVTKALRVREELHITRKRVESHAPQTFEVRREEVTVERIENADSHQGSAIPADRRGTNGTT